MFQKYLNTFIKNTQKVFLLFFLITSLSYSKIPILNNTTPKDIQRYSKSSEKNFSESWVYSIYADSNFQMQVIFSLGGIPTFKKPVIGTSLFVSNFYNKHYSVAREYSTKYYSFDPQTHKLSFHPKIWTKGILPQTHYLHFETTKKNVYYYVNLTFSEIEDGKILDNGISKFRDKKKRIFTKTSFPIPYAKVSGIVVIQNDTLKINGFANLFHHYKNTGKIDFINHSYQYSNPQNKELGFWLQHKQQKIKGYGITKKNDIYQVLPFPKFRITQFQKKGKTKIPKHINLTPSLHHQLNSPFSDFSLLAEFSGFTKFAIKKVAGGELYHFYGTGFSLHEKEEERTKIYYRFSKLK